MPVITEQAAILVVGAGDQEPSTVAEQLNRRYGAEYDVIVEQSAARGLERLMSLRGNGRDVAIQLGHVLAGRGSFDEAVPATGGRQSRPRPAPPTRSSTVSEG